MWQNILILTIVALSGLANLFLAIYVYTKNPKVRINRSFLNLGLAIFLWCFINFISLISKDLFWLRITFATGSAVGLFSVFFSYALADKKLNKFLGYLLSIIFGGFFVASIFTPLLVKDLVSFTNFGSSIISGPLFNYWGAYISFLFILSVYILLSVVKKVDDERKNQILYFMTGASIFAAWSIFVSAVLPAIGITGFNNVDTPSTIFIAGFTSYAIIRYHLLGISSLLFKAFIYSLIIIGIIVILLVLMFIGSYLFAHEMFWPIYIIAVLTAVILFFIGRLFFLERRDLEKAKASLTVSLRKSEENRARAETERDKTATIIRSFSDGLVILDEKNKIISVNPETEKILDLKAEKLLNKELKSLADFPKGMPIISALSIGFANIFKKEINLISDFIIELSVIPLKLNQENIGHLIVLHDVSREKMIEKMKTEFVSLVAHQLRTPLTAVNWSMGLLKNGEFGKLTKKQGEVIESTLNNNKRLIALVNNILNITKIEEGKYLSETSKMGMKEIVNFVISSYQPEIKKAKVKVEFNAPEKFPQTMVDVEKMKLAVQNLIDNAIKYSKEGGKIIITLTSDDKNIEFKMQDFGIGIPKNQQRNVFTKFFRGENAQKVDPNGTGLGLFLTENIIKAHSGKIWFESEEGVGTSVIFSLPLNK